MDLKLTADTPGYLSWLSSTSLPWNTETEEDIPVSEALDNEESEKAESPSYLYTMGREFWSGMSRMGSWVRDIWK